ncbi:MAG: tetratricopeptide repeat protein, partial [Alphaproteobacteria bacterium]
NWRRWMDAGARGVWLEKIPLLLIAAAAGVVAFLAKQETGALKSIHQYGILGRLAQSVFALVFYLTKTLFPVRLSPLYEMPKELNPWALPFVISGVVVIAITVALIILRRRCPGGLAAWIFYIIVVGPVLGIFQSGPQMAADRYTYLSCMGWAVLAAGSLLYSWRLRRTMQMRLILVGLVNGLAIAAVIELGVATWTQTQIWHDSERLWKHALGIMPSGLAHFYLATALADLGRSDEAIEHFRKTLEIDPEHADSHYNLGKLLLRRGDFGESAEHFRRVLKLNPKDAGAFNGLGLISANKGQLDEAIGYFRRALELNPSDGGTHNNLAIALAAHGNTEEAILHFRRALEANPSDAATHSNLARALLQKGDTEGAVQHLRRALEINPKDAAIHSTLGMILARQGNLAEATRHFRSALEFNSNDPGTHVNLAVTLARQNDVEGAAKHFQEALRLRPDLAEAHAGLARVLAMQGKTDEAVRHYQQALAILKSQSQAAGASKQ